jgi:hypothetical protein
MLVKNDRIRGKQKGFSLIIVLMVTLCAMFLLGGALGLQGVFAGSSVRSVASDQAYNVLEHEIEKAKGKLKMEMISRKNALRRAAPNGAINSLKDLLVVDGGGAVFLDTDSKVMVGGRMSDMNIRIYDMLYDPKNISSSAMPPDDVPLLPPAVKDLNLDTSVAPSAGVYLIRASLKVPNEDERRIDVSITQNANPSIGTK